MKQVVLELGLFDPQMTNSTNVTWSEMTLRPLLEMTAWADTVHLHVRPNLPALYELGSKGLVRYKMENDQPGVEPFYGINEIIKRGGSDCNNLCPWAVAELRVRGTRPLWPSKRDTPQSTVRKNLDWNDRKVRYAKGEPASFRILKFERPNKPLLYHVQIRRAPSSIISNPLDPLLVEDPSAILGMASP